MAIAEHALASRLPTPTATGSIQPGVDQFEEFAAPPDAPHCLQDFLTRDVSQLGLHVVSFADATLVSLTFPHTMCDLLGLQAIVENWVLVLANRPHDVAPLLGTRSDPLAGVGEGALHEREEPWALRGKILSGLGWFRFVAAAIWDAVRLGSSEQHMIFLPAASVHRLRESATADLVATASGDVALVPAAGDWHPQNVPFLTDNDILTAWLTRMAAHGLPPGSGDRPVTFLNFFEVRGRLPSVFRTPNASPSKGRRTIGGACSGGSTSGGGVYIGNFIFACWAHLSAREAKEAPLGAVAARYRAFLAAQTTEGQVRGLLRVFRERTAAGRRMGAMAPGSLMVSCSNWSKAKFFASVDLSPAVVMRGDAKAAGQPFGPRYGPGRPVYYHGLNLRPVGSGRSKQVGAATGVNILGKDAGGNYWITAMLPPRSWPRIQQELEIL